MTGREKAPQPKSRPPSSPDLLPEFEAKRGDPNDWFFNQLIKPWPPSVAVLNALSRYLRGRRTVRRLKLITRNGRPSQEAILMDCARGNEPSLAAKLESLARSIEAGVVNAPDFPLVQARAFVDELANVLNPDGSGTWKLVFSKRFRPGNPSGGLRTTIKNSILGHRTEDLRTELGSLSAVYDEMDCSKKDIQDETTRKRALSLVRNPEKFAKSERKKREREAKRKKKKRLEKKKCAAAAL
ncbi:MAG: hypothetical protein NTZ72_16000 [Afipia sp.]|nr:hypothetical protein [Afipia sp.]